MGDPRAPVLRVSLPLLRLTAEVEELRNRYADLEASHLQIGKERDEAEARLVRVVEHLKSVIARPMINREELAEIVFDAAAQPKDVVFVEEPCEYRSEYPGNVGPRCWRCTTCKKLAEHLKGDENERDRTRDGADDGARPAHDSGARQAPQEDQEGFEDLAPHR